MSKSSADKAKKAARDRYLAQTKTDTVLDVIGAGELDPAYFSGNDWKPDWAAVEFVSPPAVADFDACLRNISKEGKEQYGFFVPAGTFLPLGAAMPPMTVLKYGGYFPAGTSFQGGVMIPIHARMVNQIPKPTFDMKTLQAENLCCVQ